MVLCSVPLGDMLQPEVIVEMAVQQCSVHVQKHGVYVVPVDEHSISKKKRRESWTLSSLIHASTALLLLVSRFLRRFGSRSHCSGRAPCLPVVQVMGDAVAVAAFRELGHDAGCVRYAVAILTLRHHLVLLLVTGYAEQRLVLCLAGNEHVVCFCVAGCALLGRCIRSVHDVLRLVSLVALLAVAGALVSSVSLVALGTLRNLAVDIVAE